MSERDVSYGRMVIIGRQARGMRACDLAASVGLTASEIADIEDGLTHAGVFTRAALCMALDYPPNFFRQDARRYDLGYWAQWSYGPWSRYERPPVKARPVGLHTYCDCCDEPLSAYCDERITGVCITCQSRRRTRKTPTAVAAYAAEERRRLASMGVPLPLPVEVGKAAKLGLDVARIALGDEA